MIDKPARGEALLCLTNMDELNRDVNIGRSPGCNDHVQVNFAVLWYTGQGKSRVRTLNIRRVNFQLFKELVDGTPQATALKDK